VVQESWTHNLLHSNYNTTDVVQESWAHNLLHANYNTTDVVQESRTHNLQYIVGSRLLNHISDVIVSVQ
jgi:hypothetical protein